MKKTKTTNCRYGRLHLHIIHVLVWLGAVAGVVALLYHRNQRFEVLAANEDIRAKTGPVASTKAPSDKSSDVSTFRTIGNVIDVNSVQNSSVISFTRQ